MPSKTKNAGFHNAGSDDAGARRVLVTGGAGFLGSHLCDRLIAQGHHVLCMDDLSTGDARNIAHLRAHPNFEFIRHDVTQPLPMLRAAHIYNFASPASPVQYQSNPIRTAITNAVGTFHLLELAQRSNARFLQASTSEVYGDPDVHPQTEAYWGRVNPIGVRSCYDEGKRFAETLCFDYQRTRGVRVKVARIFNTYGPRMQMHDGRVVSNFIVRALRNEDIAIHGTGEQTRSFCYVDDLIEALVRTMATRDDFTGPVNVGNPDEFSMLELAEKVIALTGSKSRLVYRPLPADDPQQRCPDISLAQCELNGWRPTIDLNVGLQKTIAYFRTLI